MSPVQVPNSTKCVQICCLLVAVVLVLMVEVPIPALGASRQPNLRDHLHCKQEYHEAWEEVMQTADPYAVVEAYYDVHGEPCKTPCRIRSNANVALTIELGVKNSPNYEICGPNNKFCYNGECIAKRFQI